MMKDSERIERLMQSWTEARATEAEERELREWFRRAECISPELHDAYVLFRGLDELAAERMPRRKELSESRAEAAADAARWRDSAPRGIRWRRVVLWGAAAAVAAVGLFLGVEALRRPYCYIDGRAVYDRQTAMRTTAYLDGFSKLGHPVRMVDQLMENQ